MKQKSLSQTCRAAILSHQSSAAILVTANLRTLIAFSAFDLHMSKKDSTSHNYQRFHLPHGREGCEEGRVINLSIADIDSQVYYPFYWDVLPVAIEAAVFLLLGQCCT